MAIDIRGLAPLLSVFDMPTSIKFYCEGLGFEVVSTDGKPAPQCDWVLLRLNDAELMLNTAYDEDQRPPAPEPRSDPALGVGSPTVAAASKTTPRACMTGIAVVTFLEKKSCSTATASGKCSAIRRDTAS